MPSASCCFWLVIYIAGNEYQTESKHRETFWRFFMDQNTQDGPEAHLRGAPREHNPPRRALVGCSPQVLLWPILGVLVHKKSPKSFAVFGLRLILISCDVKNIEKTATGTWHYVNRLVPKNDIK